MKKLHTPLKALFICLLLILIQPLWSQTTNKLTILPQGGRFGTRANTYYPVTLQIRNDTNTMSMADTLFLARWQRVFYNGGYYCQMYSPTLVPVPPIAPSQVLTLNTNLLIPNILKSDYLSSETYLEHYFVFKNRADAINRGAPISKDSAKKIGYYFPIYPQTYATVHLSGHAINTSWDSLNRTLELRLVLENKTNESLDNIVVNLHKTFTNSGVYPSSDVDYFQQISGIGQVERRFNATGSRDDIGDNYNVWKITKLAPYAKLEAVFKAQVVGLGNFPQVANDYYRSLMVQPRLIYIEHAQSITTNDLDTYTEPLVFRFDSVAHTPILPDLSLANVQLDTLLTNPNKVLSYRFDIRNIGRADATNNFSVKAYLSKDKILSADDIQDGIVPTGNFQAGAAVANVQGASRLSAQLTTGHYYLILKVDADNTIAETNENNNIIASPQPFLVVATPSEKCVAKFELNAALSLSATCEIPVTSRIARGDLQMYGTRFADGFMTTFGASYRTSTVFTKSIASTTPPIGSKFTNCTANWLYFNTEGIGSASQRNKFIDSNFIIRVRFWGQDTNPDSIVMELDSAILKSYGNDYPTIFKSISKTKSCGGCFQTDKTPPQFNNIACDGSTVDYPNPHTPNDYILERILYQIKSRITDDCNGQSVFYGTTARRETYYWGHVYPFYVVAYDSIGNKASCHFKVRFPCQYIYKPALWRLPKDTVLTLASGQNCRTYKWDTPMITSGLPSKLESNFPSNHCFPLGTTQVIYTAVDSCGNTGSWSFNVKVIQATTDIEDIKEPKNGVKVYPNPFKDQTTIELPPQYQGDFELKIYDITARLLETKTISDTKFTFNRGNLKSGVYFFSVSNNKIVFRIGKLLISD